MTALNADPDIGWLRIKAIQLVMRHYRALEIPNALGHAVWFVGHVSDDGLRRMGPRLLGGDAQGHNEIPEGR